MFVVVIHVADQKNLDIIHMAYYNMPISESPQKSISLNFITDLSPSKGFDCILTDRFTKIAHFIPCMKAITSQETTELLMREVFRHHGLADDIISD